MMSTFLAVALVSLVGGLLIGYIACGAAYRRLRRRIRNWEHPKKTGVMDRILVLEAVILFVYTVACLIEFWHTGSEPSTLTACVFGVCGMENGVMGWIKTNKDRIAEAERENNSKEQGDGNDDG